MKKILFSLTFVLLFSPCVYACNNSIKSSQKTLASNVNFDLNYKIVENKANFHLIVTGLSEHLYITDENDKVYVGNEDGVVVISNLSDGQKYRFYINSQTYSYCSFGTLLTRTISIPSYNPYYNDELCLNHKDSNLCSRWNNFNLTYDEFKKAIGKLDSEQGADIVDDVVKDEEDIFDYAIWIVLGTAFLSGIVIYGVKRKNVGF